MNILNGVKPALLSLSLAGAMAVAGTAQADTYKIDPTHTSVTFHISHLGYSELVVRFNTVEGSSNYDPANPNASSVTVNIPLASLDTNLAERDEHLKGEEFLNVANNPTMTFTSTSFKMDDDDADEGKLTGNLTINGVTKTVVIDVDKVGEGKDPWGGYRAGFEGDLEINRSDFNVSGMPKLIGDKVEIDLQVEGIRQ